MRFMKWASIVGFCAVSFVPAWAAAADQWIVNCESKLCLDVRGDKETVQLSECDGGKTYQQWKTSELPKLPNAGAENKCLDMTKGREIKADDCNDGKDAQKWMFTAGENGGELICNEYFTDGKSCLMGVKDLNPVESGEKDPSNRSQNWKRVDAGSSELECPTPSTPKEKAPEAPKE